MQMKKLFKISLVLVIVLALFTPFVMAVEDEDDDEVEINIKEELGEVEEVDTEAPKEESEELENETNIEAGASEDEFVFGDFSKATTKITTSTNQFKHFDFTVENATLVKSNTYYVLITHKKEDTSYIKDTLKNGELEAKGYKVVSNDNLKVDITKYAEENGDIHYTIVEKAVNGKGESSYKVAKTGTIERLPFNPVGDRIKCFFFDDETSTFFYEFSQQTDSKRKIKLKIGPVTDNNILIGIRDGKANALNNLLTYAKNSSQTIYTGSVPVGRSATITTNLDIKNKGYYYVYMQMEDENGKYYPVEDVSLYQGLVSESVGKNLFDYLDDNFKWEIANGNGNNVVDPTIAPGVYPKTGAIVLGIVGIALIGTSILLFIKNMKYRDVK